MWADRLQLEAEAEATLDHRHLHSILTPAVVNALGQLLRARAPRGKPAVASTGAASSTASSTALSAAGAAPSSVRDPALRLQLLQTCALFAVVGLLERSPPASGLGVALRPLLPRLNELAAAESTETPPTPALRAALLAQCQESLAEAAAMEAAVIPAARAVGGDDAVASEDLESDGAHPAAVPHSLYEPPAPAAGTPVVVVPFGFRQEYCEKVLFQGADRRTVKYIGRGQDAADRALLTTDAPIPADAAKFYFEVAGARANVCLVVAWARAHAALLRLLGRMPSP